MVIIGIRDGLSLKMAREDIISVEEMLVVQVSVLRSHMQVGYLNL